MTFERHRATPRACLFSSMAATALVAVRTSNAGRDAVAPYSCKDCEGGAKFFASKFLRCSSGLNYDPRRLLVSPREGQSTSTYFGGQGCSPGLGDTKLQDSRRIVPWLDPALADQTSDRPLAGRVVVVLSNPVSVRHQLK